MAISDSGSRTTRGLPHRFFAALLFIAVLSGIIWFVGSESRTSPTGRSNAATEPHTSVNLSQINETFGELEMNFESNEGQTDSAVDFLARGPGYALFLGPVEATFVLSADSGNAGAGKTPDITVPGRIPSSENRAIRSQSVIKLQLLGGKAEARSLGVREQEGKSNYFIGNDPERWRTDVPNFGRVRFADVYEGIDIEYYGNGRQLEYDFHIAPGADVKQITMQFGGAESVSMQDETGSLLINVDGKTLRQHKPIAYQEFDGKRVQVDSRFVFENGRIAFEVGEYDRAEPLVIDPVLVYSTYYGQSGFDYADAVTVDATGNIYVMGGTNSMSFPITNAIQSVYGGGDNDTFVMKLNASGSAVIYSTFLGGSRYDGSGAITVDASGNVYVTGRTVSENFPSVNAIQPAYFGFVYGDAFITKINAAGSAIVYSTYLGGTYMEQGSAIAVDASGSVYVGGQTQSSEFPTVLPFQANRGGNTDGFLIKITPSGTALEFSTYLGGIEDDFIEGLAVDAAGNIYVAGVTTSPNFPTFEPIQGVLTQNGDVFVTKFNPTASVLTYSTYLGGNDSEGATDLALDSSGNVYITGYTFSSNFPTVNPIQSTRNGLRDAFVTKINATGSALIYSTYLGGGGLEDYGSAIALDPARNVYIAGTTNSADFPIVNAVQATYGGGTTDGFLTKINPEGSALVYSTFLGGIGRNDAAYDVAVDAAGNAYTVGRTDSTNFPTAGPIRAYAGSLDAFILKVSDGPPPTPVPGVTPTPTPTLVPDPSPTPVKIVISQIYGAGGVTGAAYRNSYVEVFNAGPTTADLNGVLFNLAPANGTFDRRYSRISSNQPIPLLPGQYFLLKGGTGGTSGAELPLPDLDASQGPFNATFTNIGKWAISAANTNILSGTCPLPNTSVYDFVGFGPTNCWEGSGPAPALGPTIAIYRAGGGCTDTDNNAADFSVAAPGPRNSSSPLNPCFSPSPTPTPSPSPTPAMISITGRVLTPSGTAIRSAVVSLVDAGGNRRTATTSSFGVYTFANVTAGQPYTLTVASKRYRFAPQSVTTATSISNLDLVGLE